MASGDHPKRRAAPLPATDSATDVDDSTHPGRRPTEPGDAAERTTVSPMPGDSSGARPAKRPQQTKRRDDATAWPDEMPPRTERPKRPRSGQIEDSDNPDVVGAPERTVIAPLPPQDESVEPVPQPRSSTRSDETRRERVRDQARGETRVDRRPAPASERDNVRQRRPRPDEPNQALVHQKTQIEPTGGDAPGRRLRIALHDVWAASVFAVNHHWGVLRARGLKPYIEAARPRAQRALAFMQRWAVRAKIIAVKSAVRVGLVKPRRIEYELESSDRADRARADAWRRFHDGRKSSSYLQDDE